MNFNFYLSETPMSERYGVGLTMQRILGSDLDKIEWFLQLSPSSGSNSTADRFAPKCLDFPAWEKSDLVRGLIGSRASNWLYHRRGLRRLHARRVAYEIFKRFRHHGKPIIGLICPQGIDSLYVIDEFSKFTETEYITWFMDDHLVKWDRSAWSYSEGVEDLLKRHLKRARAVFTISPAMQASFLSRFGVESEVLFGPAEALGSPVWQRPSGGKTVRLGYFGALFSWQTDALKLLAERLEYLDAVLDIYSADLPCPPFLRNPGVNFLGRLSPQQVRSMMSKYDAVVLPVSFEPQARNLSEFNIATKMSECLSSGTLTLVIAPLYSVMRQILANEQAAVIVAENSDVAFQNAIERIRTETDRADILRAARRYVEISLTSEAMRQVWDRGTSQAKSVAAE